MSDYYTYKKIKKIDNIEKIINGNIFEPEYINIDKISPFEITSVRGLFDAIQQVRAANRNQQQKINSSSQPRGTTYNQEVLKTRWSPQSSNIKVPEWYRGVIVIGPSGKTVKYNLDRPLVSGILHHADSTVLLARFFGIEAKQDGNNPVIPAVDSSEKGLVVIQTEGDALFAYIPDNMTNNQIQATINCLEPRKNFEIGYAYRGELYDEASIDAIRDIMLESLGYNAIIEDYLTRSRRIS